MTKNKTPNLSEFGEAALALDREFLQMERLARELERLENPNDKGLERSQTLLAEVEVSRERMAANMQVMVQALELLRQRNESAEKIIAERAAVVQERQIAGEKLLERYRLLAEMVRQITAAIIPFQRLKGDNISPDDRAALASHIPQINEQLAVLVEESNKLMKDARDACMKALERNTDSLRQSLEAVRRRLTVVAERDRPRPEEGIQESL